MDGLHRGMKSLMLASKKFVEGPQGLVKSCMQPETQQVEKLQHADAPHPIPAGREDAICPITGLSAADLDAKHNATAIARTELEADPDIEEERLTFSRKRADGHLPIPPPSAGNARIEFLGPVPLNVINRKHLANATTIQLVRSVGGLDVLRRFTNLFYKKSFADPHIDKFIRSHEDPHGERFASWIVEKFGDGTPWSDERITRPRTQLKIGREIVDVSFDRSSAHYAAWHSPKREAHKWGQHFKPDDARVWMRLHFWAAREVGLFQPECKAFMEYYIRFIGHFISIYSSKSPPFTRESARWSANPENLKRYAKAGNVMHDVIGKPVDKALLELPAEERLYTGSGLPNSAWPYELSPN